MHQVKLGLGTSAQFGIGVEEQLTLFKQIGFESFFTGWSERIKGYREVAERLGLEYRSVHAPFTNAANIWRDGEVGDRSVEELLRCVEDCAEAEVPVLVVHTYIGFAPSEGPTQSGIENFRRIVEAAALKNVKIAFENTEGEEYLDALMRAFGSYENVGFCWDTGHELCYNKGKDMMALYGERLLCTHLNDNLGIRNFNGEITWRDDLHLLPFDGITDWNDVARRLNRSDYQGTLTFELCKKSKDGRFDNDKYDRMKLEEYLTEAYARACRVATLKIRQAK